MKSIPSPVLGAVIPRRAPVTTNNSATRSAAAHSGGPDTNGGQQGPGSQSGLRPENPVRRILPRITRHFAADAVNTEWGGTWLLRDSETPHHFPPQSPPRRHDARDVAVP